MKNFTWKDIKIMGFIMSLIIMFSISISTLNKKVKPIVIEYSRNKSVEMANLIINNSILEVISEINQPCIIVNEDDNGKINSFSYNTVLLNKIAYKTNEMVNKNIKLIQEGKLESLSILNDVVDYRVKNDSLYYQIPLFVGSSNFLLTSLGPDIPIKFQLIGNTKTDLVSSVTSYGMNNVMVEVIMKVKLNLKVLVPFDKENNEIETSLAIASLAIQGEVPNYYIGSGSIDNISGKIPVT